VYYERFLTKADCPRCGQARPLHEFRKWWGPKRMLRTLCVRCEPEKSLEQMTPEERITALDQQRAYVTPVRVARLNEADAMAIQQRRSTGTRRRHAAERVRAWSPTLKVLRAERLWAQQHAADPASPAWGRFFEAYEAALTDALRRAVAARGNASRTPSRIQPTPDQADPMHWLHDITINTLRRLYSDCAPVRGRKLYRDPLFLAN
jgi:hypothetical protein